MYDEAFSFMCQLQKKMNTLDESQQKLLMQTSKGKIKKSQTAWKNILYFDDTDINTQLIPDSSIEKEMKKYENEIKKFSVTMIEIIDSLLSVNTDDINSKIFYYWLKADFCRFYTEVADEEEFVEYTNKSEDLYREAYQSCISHLNYKAPLTLNVVINYAVFTYDILDDVKRAFNIADSVYKQVSEKEEDSAINNYEVETLIRLLEERLATWKLEMDDDE